MPVSWQLVGAVLFGIAALLAYCQLARRDDPEGLLFGALILVVAFFALPTRVHERYMFLALALAAPLVLRRWRRAAACRPPGRPPARRRWGCCWTCCQQTALLHPDATAPAHADPAARWA